MDVFHKIKSADLQGQIAIVTGGGRGLGRVFALELATRGAVIAVTGRSQPQLSETVARINDAGGRAVAFVADVTDYAAATRVVDEVEKTFGPVDLLVNNAGIVTPLGAVADADIDQWWLCMDVNLRGPLIYCKAVLPKMIARHRGRIINVASGAGTGCTLNMSAYVVSKTSLIRLTELLAAEIRDHGVQVFAIEPGTVRTAMTDYLRSPEGQRQTPSSISIQTIFEKGYDTPPEYAANLILKLASGRADPLSGHYIEVNDDVDRMAAQVKTIHQRELYSLRVRKLRRTLVSRVRGKLERLAIRLFGRICG